MFIFTRDFWIYAGERALKTVAQAAVAAFTAGEVAGIFDVDFMAIISVSIFAGITSILTSIGFHGQQKETD